MVLPLGKVFYLAVKQLAKPVANAIKSNARNYPAFKRRCVAFAQFYHRTESWITIRMLGNFKAVKVKELNEAKAVNLGAEVLGEILIFSLGSAIIVEEYARSSRKEAKKELKLANAFTALETKVLELEVLLHSARKEQQLLRKRVAELENTKKGIITSKLPIIGGLSSGKNGKEIDDGDEEDDVIKPQVVIKNPVYPVAESVLREAEEDDSGNRKKGDLKGNNTTSGLIAFNENEEKNEKSELPKNDTSVKTDSSIDAHGNATKGDDVEGKYSGWIGTLRYYLWL
eukprot:Nk52_evm5s1607 gene=Nk52_evmTU5s1607